MKCVYPGHRSRSIFRIFNLCLAISHRPSFFRISKIMKSRGFPFSVRVVQSLITHFRLLKVVPENRLRLSDWYAPVAEKNDPHPVHPIILAPSSPKSPRAQMPLRTYLGPRVCCLQTVPQPAWGTLVEKMSVCVCAHKILVKIDKIGLENI